ncbi:hypothetical protein F5884DRAFT_851069 [Xylogone sp. PMI_703]|nr:hypothetical protein F5884DRAFT_851069 [Xylogone sp. PMI_703]
MAPWTSSTRLVEPAQAEASNDQPVVASRLAAAVSDLSTSRMPQGRQGRQRRGHRKSRQGCFNCKKRKIKCQETFPTCENCARLSIRCQYMQTSAITLSSWNPCNPQAPLNTTPDFDLTDFRLFHHYLVAAYPHFPVASEDIWLNYITPIGHQSGFLMHALLGLSASHLSKISSASFTAVAQNHRLKASKGLNEALSAPLRSPEEADAVIAACHALLFQSCLVSKQVRDQNIQALLAQEDLDSRAEIMSARLDGTPSFNTAVVDDATSSLNALLPICSKNYQREFLECLLENVLALRQKSTRAYHAHTDVCKFIVNVSHADFIELCEPTNTACQLLIAHLIALHLIMRPISCRERKKYTVAMYRIRMSTWIDRIYQDMDPSFWKYLEWPINISNLHKLEILDSHILCY